MCSDGLQDNSCGRGVIGKNTLCTGSYPAAICIPGIADQLVVSQDPGSQRCTGPGIGVATLVVTHMLSVSRLGSLEHRLSGIKLPTFLECFFSVTGINGVEGSPAVLLGPAGAGERMYVFLFLRGVALFFILGEFDAFAVNFTPLTVFSFVHIILSQVGDEETVRAHFPCIGGSVKEQ